MRVLQLRCVCVDYPRVAPFLRLHTLLIVWAHVDLFDFVVTLLRCLTTFDLRVLFDCVAVTFDWTRRTPTRVTVCLRYYIAFCGLFAVGYGLRTLRLLTFLLLRLGYTFYSTFTLNVGFVRLR